MTMLALEMRSISQAALSNTYKREEADFNRQLALWTKMHKERAKQAIASLPECVRAAAEEGHREVLLRVEIDPPYTFGDTYKELRINHDFGKTESWIQLSPKKCKILPEGSRPIARWALQQGFGVHTFKWEYDKERYILLRRGYYEVDNFRSHVIACPDGERQYSLHEGIVITW